VERKESPLSKVMVLMPQVNLVIGAQEPGAAFETWIVNATNLLVGNYNIMEHNTCKGLWGGQLNRVFELAGVLCQPRSEPIVRKRKSGGMVPTSAPKRAIEKRRRVRGSSRSGDRTSVKELALAKSLKLSKKFVLHSSKSSSAGGGSAAPAPAHTLDLFDLGSSASDAEPTDPVPSQKCSQKSPVLEVISKPSKAPTAKGTLEQLIFLRSSWSYDIQFFLFFAFATAKTVVASASAGSKGSES
jgi:hypothetical protein